MQMSWRLEIFLDFFESADRVKKSCAMSQRHSAGRFLGLLAICTTFLTEYYISNNVNYVYIKRIGRISVVMRSFFMLITNR